MAVSLYSPGSSHAESLINDGKYDDTTPWTFTTEDGDKLLGPNGDDWTNYASFHLGEDTAEAEKTKARYKYPFGKDGKVYDKGLRAIRTRAAQNGATSIFDRAGELRDLLDKKEGGTETTEDNATRGLVFPFPKQTAKSILTVSAAAVPNTYNMDLFGVVGGEFWGDGGITKEQFASMLNQIPNNCTKVNLRMSSPGGDVFDGRAIANMMKQNSCSFDVNIIAEASSIASIIAMAGDTIHMGEGAMMLVHRCYTFAMGNSKELTALAADLNTIDETMVKTYCQKTGMQPSDMISLMDENRYMPAEEAKAKGFVDTIDTGVQDSSSYKIAAYGGFRERFKLPPLPKSGSGSTPKREAALRQLQALGIK